MIIRQISITNLSRNWVSIIIPTFVLYKISMYSRNKTPTIKLRNERFNAML